MSKFIKLRQYLVSILIVGLTIHAPLITWLDLNFGANFWLRSWKEIVVLVLVLLSLPAFFAQKIYKTKLFLLILAFSLVLLLVSALNFRGLSSLVGLRTDIFPLLVFLVGLCFGPKDLNKFSKITIFSGLVVALSIISQLFLPPQWFVYSLFGASQQAVSFIQDSGVARLHGVMSGPLQASSFLVLVFAVFLPIFKSKKLQPNVKMAGYALLAVLFMAVFLTYSRAGLGGILVVYLAYQALTKKTKIKLKYLVVLGASLFLVGLSAFWFEPLSLLVFHAPIDKALTESSTSDHFIYLIEGFGMMILNPLGLGAGIAGPASWLAKNHLATENFYIQIGLEAGLLGLGLYLATQIQIAKFLKSHQNFGLLAGLLGLSAMSLLLNTWTDTATAWTFYLLAGVAISPKLLDRPKAFARHKPTKNKV